MSAPDDDRRFSERVAAAFAPPPMTPDRAAAFDRALEGRRRRRRPAWPMLVPALAGAAAALWFALRPAPAPPPVTPVAVAAADDWPLDEPFFEDDLFDETDDAAALPPDYLALAMAAELEADTEETP